MIITEKDILIFVFNPSSLDQAKYDEISGNKNYSYTIAYFQQIKESIREGALEDFESKLEEKIPAYNMQLKTGNIFVLKPSVHSDNFVYKDEIVLAAASERKDERQQSVTYHDDKKQFLIRLIYTPEKTSVYLFTADNEILEQVKLRFLPDRTLFTLTSNREPLSIKISSVPEEIELEL